jgi:hypothetical protein
MDATKQAFASHGILPVESGKKEPALIVSHDGKGKAFGHRDEKRTICYPFD